LNRKQELLASLGMFADAEINQKLSPDDKRLIYAKLCKLRFFSEAAMQLYQQGAIAGFLPMRPGQESIAVALRSLMSWVDHSICGFAGIEHALAAGLSMRRAMAELCGRANGASGGRAGAMGLFSVEDHHWGNHALAGTQAALGIGLAFGIKYRAEAGVAVCFLGEGCMNQGVVHEALNLAALQHLPIVFVMENNRYSMGTSVARGSALGGPLAQRAEGYGMAWELLGSDDIYEIRAKLHPWLQRARNQHEPALVEIPTYRFKGFSIADANMLKYRSKAEVEEQMRTRDPLMLWEKQLASEGILSAAEAMSYRMSAKLDATDAIGYAEGSAWPEVADIQRAVYWSSDHPETPSYGRHFFD
jgi:pyruvate dehydrogenase E1 component alpha subunit